MNNCFTYKLIKARYFIFTLLISLQCIAQAGDIRIGLFYRQGLTSVTFSVTEGEYIIYGDYKQIGIARKGTIYHIENTRDLLTLQDTSKAYGKYTRIEFKGVSAENAFRVKPVFPSLPAKESDDNLILQAESNVISIINILNLEKYIAGTVEAEGGPNAHLEYYKAQAILTRTFALKSFYRHGAEGYNLCDTEHCQAYKGRSRMNQAIQDATQITSKLVMTDLNGILVNTAYHSNCGGMTSDAFLVWKQSMPYLRSIPDPFCKHSHNAVWEATLTRSTWNNYLAKRGVEKKWIQQPVFSYHPEGREKALILGNIQLQLADIRLDLNLKSSWFSIDASPTSVVFHGKGFGHGVGMCQEGAMDMALKGYTYVDILHFYFTNVLIEKRTEE